MSYKTPFISELTETTITGGAITVGVPATYDAREAKFYLDANNSLCIAYADNTISAVDFSGAGTDNLTAGGTYAGTAANTVYHVQIYAAGTPDTFAVYDSSNTLMRSGVEIDGTAQDLLDGITGTFATTSGHTSGDKWYITVAALHSGVLISGS